MEKKTQLYFADDQKLEFRKLELKFSCLLEKAGDKIKRAFRHSYSGQYNFPGYRNISADTVTLGFARDIFLDPHDKIPITGETTGKPEKKGEKIVAWIAKIATNQRHIYRAEPDKRGMNEYINYTLIFIDLIIVIAWGIRFAIR